MTNIPQRYNGELAMDGFCGEGTAINSFSVVAYVPQPLGGFIERLRQEMQPGCTARSHLTFLPPRPLEIPLDEIRIQMEAALKDQHAFRAELCEVRVFPVSHAVHLSLGAGWAEAVRIHQALHCRDLCCMEFFEYHPHVTLAQDLDPASVAAVAELASRRWQEYSGKRDFLVNHVTLVQNTLENRWTNLGEFPLRVPVTV
jgi:2'-5' RNA ligase